MMIPLPPDVQATALAAAAGAGLAAWSCAALLASGVAGMRRSWRAARARLPRLSAMLASRPEGAKGAAWLARWIEEMEPKLRKAQLGLAAERFFALTVLAALLGFLAGALVLKNLLAALIIAALMVVVPDQLVVARIQARRERLADQLAPAASMTYAELATSRNPHLALGAVARRAPEPIASALRRTAALLDSRSADPDAAFGFLAQALDFEYGRLYAQIMREIWEGKDIRGMLPRLALKCGTYQRMIRKTKAELTWFRITGSVLNVLALPAFLAEMAFFPDARAFLTGTAAGRFVTALCFLSLLVGTIVNRVLAKVDY
jgi:Flp pilus assembly protein TadB